MKKKIRILILISTIGLVGIIALQFVMMRTAHKHEVQQYKREVNLILNKIISENKDIIEMDLHMDTTVVQMAGEFGIGQSGAEEILNKIETWTYRTQITQIFEKELSKQLDQSDIEFGLFLTHLSFLDLEADSMVSILDTRPRIALNNQVYGNLADTTDLITHTSNSWSSSDTDKYGIFVSTRFDYVLPNINSIVFSRIKWLLLGVVFCSVLVISIFVITLRSLIRQKKLADIKTDLINNISHEFKTPLATLGLAAANLKNPTLQADPEKRDKTLAIMLRQSEKLQKLVDQVTRSSIAETKLELNKIPTDIMELTKTCAEDFDFSEHRKPVTITTTLPKLKSLAKVDQFHFGIVVQNILENAVKYGGEHVRVHINGEETKDEIKIELQDNGPGFGAQNLGHVFEKFYRANRQNSTGLGLGLFYAKQIITAHDGQISAQNLPPNEGGGARLTLSIPKNNSEL